MARGSVVPFIRDVWHDSKRVHVVGRLQVRAGDYATEVAVGDHIEASGEYRLVSQIDTDLQLIVSAAFTNIANDLNPKRIDESKRRTLTGSINATASASVVGVGTKFLGQVKIGEYLMLGTADTGEIKKVIAIADDTNLTVDAAFTNLADDTSPEVLASDGLVFMNGSIDPAASTTVTGVNTKFLGYGLIFNLVNDGPKKLGISRAPISVQLSSRNGLVYKYETLELQQRLSGSVDTAVSATVPGVTTKFIDELAVGDRVLFGAEERYVTAIASQTSLTVHRAHTDQGNDTAPKKYVKPDSVQAGVLRIYGMFVLGGQAAAATKALYAISGLLAKEEAANAYDRLSEHFTAALDNIVLDDTIDFHAILKNL